MSLLLILHDLLKNLLLSKIYGKIVGESSFFTFNTCLFCLFCMIFLRIYFYQKFMEKLLVKVLLKGKKKKKSVYIFCSLSWSSLSLIRCSYFNKKLRHTKLLHTTAPGYKGWRKNSLRNIFVSDRDPQWFFFIILP